MAPVFEQFALADQYATSIGSKICALSCDNAPVEVVIPGRVKAPFEPGNFDKAYSTRQTLQLRCGPELEDYFKGLDAWAIDNIAEHAEGLLKKPLTKEQVIEGYTMSGCFGWVVEVTDLLVIDAEAVAKQSPFIGRSG